jgi:lipopolysaccharide transport system permease protein
MGIWSILFRHRWVLWSMITREVSARYAGSILGLIWLIIFPLLFLFLYSFVYTYVFTLYSQKMPLNEYLLLIYCALVPFLAVSECMSSGTSSLVANRNIVTGTLFPVELLPVRYAGASMAVLVSGFLLLVPAAWSQGIVHWTQLLLPVAMVVQFVFMVGLAWICGTIYVFFRDFGQIVGLLIMMLMLLSPIAFDRTMLPESLQAVTAVNPLFPFMELYRGLCLRGVIPWFDALASVLIALVTFQLGAFLCTRLKVEFGAYL